MKLALWHSITQTAGLSVTQHSFIQTAQSLPDPYPFLVSGPIPSNRYRRSLAVTSAVLVAALLHGGLLFWYVTRPAPLPFTAAAPLPMISMELSAPPSPVVNQPYLAIPNPGILSNTVAKAPILNGKKSIIFINSVKNASGV